MLTKQFIKDLRQDFVGYLQPFPNISNKLAFNLVNTVYNHLKIFIKRSDMRQEYSTVFFIVRRTQATYCPRREEGLWWITEMPFVLSCM